MAYTYDPTMVGTQGKDRMRFEIGDTLVSGAEETCALTDEEINAILDTYPNSWRKARLALVESICRRFAFEVDTKVGPLSLSMRSRAEAWLDMYRELKAEAAMYAAPKASPGIGDKPPYFYPDMMHNDRSDGKKGGG